MIKFIILTVLVLGLSGCVSKRFEDSLAERIERLENGMTESEVWRLLGPPVKVQTRGDKKVFTYFPNKNDPKRPYYVRMLDSEVVGWGPARRKKRKKRQ